MVQSEEIMDVKNVVAVLVLFSRVAGEIPATLLKLNISNIKVISENGMAFYFTWNVEQRG